MKYDKSAPDHGCFRLFQTGFWKGHNLSEICSLKTVRRNIVVGGVIVVKAVAVALAVAAAAVVVIIIVVVAVVI